MTPRTLLIPSFLDDHFPLLRRVFVSNRWQPVLLTQEQGLADLGLRYIHSDMCYPAILVAGQVLDALNSGRYDIHTCGVLIGQAGDECRGSCFIRILRRALDRAGYPEVALVSLNVRGIDRRNALPLAPGMIGKALAAAVWGDTLAMARDQLRPLEAHPGSVQALWRRWVDILDQDLVRVPSRREILARCREITASFRALETVDRPVQDVAVVGEIYTKNCHLGNWNLRDYLAGSGCRVYVGGLTWQALYYMDAHALKGPKTHQAAYRAVQRMVGSIQREMIDIVRAAGFRTLPPLSQLKMESTGLAPLNVTVADGWLISAEAAGWAGQGCRKILCVQPFACLPGHIFGKGQYAALQRKLPQTRLVSVDYDASTGEGTVLSRVRMLLDEALSSF